MLIKDNILNRLLLVKGLVITCTLYIFFKYVYLKLKKLVINN